MTTVVLCGVSFVIGVLVGAILMWVTVQKAFGPKFIILLPLLLLPSTAHSQTLYKVSMVTAIAAHGADLATTEYCLGLHRCRELNHILLRFDQPASFGAAKMGLAAMQLWLVDALHRNHPRWATAANYLTTAAFVGVAAHNARASR